MFSTFSLLVAISLLVPLFCAVLGFDIGSIQNNLARRCMIVINIPSVILYACLATVWTWVVAKLTPDDTWNQIKLDDAYDAWENFWEDLKDIWARPDA